jgi:hypothetical protein
MYPRIDGAILFLFWTAVLSAPLAIWKLVEIGIYIYKHLHWS